MAWRRINGQNLLMHSKCLNALSIQVMHRVHFFPISERNVRKKLLNVEKKWNRMGNCILMTATKNNSNSNTNTKTWLKFCLFKCGFEWQRFLEWESNQFMSCFLFCFVYVLTSIMIWMQKRRKKNETILLKIMATGAVKRCFQKSNTMSI